MADNITWAGKSGAQYVYYVYDLGTTFHAKPGNYIFARDSPQGWYAVYIGETGDLSQRFDTHHKDDCIKKNGATHIHVHASSEDDQARRNEEADLIARWNPTCNG